MRYQAKRQLSINAAMVLAATLAASPTLRAQEQLGSALEEVLVTARKKTENLQSTPVAITAFTSEALALRQISVVADIGKFTPNMTFDSAANISGSSSAVTMFIRGVGQTDFNLTIDPGVGLYVDGVYVSRSIGGLLDVVDLENIQVLRGPQGALFGKNTIGGAVLLTSKRPSDEFEGSIDVTGGTDSRADFRGILNVPVTDSFKLRGSLASLNRDGFQKRLADGGKQGGQDSSSARVAALFEVSEDLDIQLSFDGNRRREDNIPTSLLRVNNDPNTALGGTFGVFHNAVLTGGTCIPPNTPPADPQCYSDQWITNDEDKTWATTKNKSDLDLWGVTLDVDWDLGFGVFQSISAYRDLDSSFRLDSDGSPLSIATTNNKYTQDQFSQELQLTGDAMGGRLGWIGGLYYLHEEGTDVNTVVFAPATFRSGGSVKNDSYAAYAQFGYDITEKLALTVGGRYTDETKRFKPDQVVEEDRTGGAFPPGTLLLPPDEVKTTAGEFTPSVTLDYQFDDDLFGYLKYSEGFKGGGFTQRIFPPREEVPDFEPEYVDAYEIGLKSELFENRLRFNVAAFYNDYSDLQIIVQDGLQPIVRNAGKATIWGYELEFEAEPIERLSLNGGLGYLNAEYDELNEGANIPVSNDLPNAPEYTANIGATIILYQASFGEFSFRSDWAYKDDHYKDAINTEDLKQKSYDIVNLSLILNSANGSWTASGGVTNATDERYLLSGYADIDTPGAGVGAVTGTYSRGREYFAEFKYRF